MIHTMSSGDHVVCIDDVYGGTQRLFRQIVSPGANFSFTFMDFGDVGKVAQVITSATKLVWLESPTNPTLKVSDIFAVAEMVHRLGRSDIYEIVLRQALSPSS